MRLRHGALAAVSTAVLLAGVLIGQGSAAGETAFAAGTGRAAAKLVKVGPSRGALTLAPQVGLALSDFIGTRGRGDVRFADLAALETSLPPEAVSQLPVVKVESSDENSEAGETLTVGTPPEVPLKVGAAELHADAGPAPYGASSFTAGSIGIGIGTIGGARASARSGVVDGNARESLATVEVPRLELAEGAVVLEAIRWEARHRTGEGAIETATFSIGGATVAGQPVGGASGGDVPLADLSAALKPVLDPLGIEVVFPVARIEGGIAELSPMRLRMTASDAAPALVPVTDAIQPARDALVGPVREGSGEQADAAILLGDIALGVLAGGSKLDIEIGGVTATTAEPAAGFRFGSGSGFQLGAADPVDLGGGSGFTTPRPVAPTAAAAPEGAGSSGGSAPVPMAVEPASSTSDPRGGPLLAVGVVGLLAALLAGAADLRKVRATRNVISF